MRAAKKRTVVAQKRETGRPATTGLTSRAENRRALILATALEHFTHYGLRGASLEEIAKAAGVSRPALYHHFSSKEELFTEMARSLCANVLGKIAEAGNEEGPIHDRLQRMFYAKATELHDMLWKSRHGMEIFDASHHLCADVNRNFHDQFERLIADVLQDGAKRGDIDLAPLAITYRAAASFLVHCAEGLHARHTGTAVDPAFYRKRLSLLIDCFLAQAGR